MPGSYSGRDAKHCLLSVWHPANSLRVTNRSRRSLDRAGPSACEPPISDRDDRLYEVPVTAMPRATGLFVAHLTVSDLDRSIEFYRDVVGLPLALVLEERAQ
jgi:hypothetical protein